MLETLSIDIHSPISSIYILYSIAIAALLTAPSSATIGVGFARALAALEFEPCTGATAWLPLHRRLRAVWIRGTSFEAAFGRKCVERGFVVCHVQPRDRKLRAAVRPVDSTMVVDKLGICGDVGEESGRRICHEWRSLDTDNSDGEYYKRCHLRRLLGAPRGNSTYFIWSFLFPLLFRL